MISYWMLPWVLFKPFPDLIKAQFSRWDWNYELMLLFLVSVNIKLIAHHEKSGKHIARSFVAVHKWVVLDNTFKNCGSFIYWWWIKFLSIKRLIWSIQSWIQQFLISYSVRSAKSFNKDGMDFKSLLFWDHWASLSRSALSSDKIILRFWERDTDCSDFPWTDFK